MFKEILRALGGALIVVLIFAMFFAIASMIETSQTQTSPNTDAVPVSQNEKILESGAINKAKKLEEAKSLKDEAEQFGFYILPSNETDYIQLKKRWEKNDELRTAIAYAKENRVMLFIGFRNQVDTGIGYIVIDPFADDETIIKFVRDSVPTVAALEKDYQTLKIEAQQFGLYLTRLEYREYKKIRERLLNNKKLVAAFKHAQRERVMIILATNFSVEKSLVRINVNATDEEIIKFLLGE